MVRYAPGLYIYPSEGATGVSVLAVTIIGEEFITSPQHNLSSSPAAVLIAIFELLMKIWNSLASFIKVACGTGWFMRTCP